MSSAMLFLSFGKVSLPLQAMEQEGRRIARTGQPLGHQVAVVSGGTPAFRFSTPGWLGASPALIAALPDRPGLRLLCRDRLEAIVPAFAAAQRRWMARYLDRLEELYPLEGDEGDPLNRPSDRFFAALLPLPAVSLLPVTARGDAFIPVDPGDFVAADLAFWDGARLTAVFFGDVNTASPRAREELTNLINAAEPMLVVRRVTATAEADRLIDDILLMIDAQPHSRFGPYRAAAFQTPLPCAVRAEPKSGFLS